MPATRQRTYAPTMRSRHRSLDGSSPSIQSDEVDSVDEEAHGRGVGEFTSAIMTEYQHGYEPQEAQYDNEEEDEDCVDEVDGGRFILLLILCRTTNFHHLV